MTDNSSDHAEHGGSAREQFLELVLEGAMNEPRMHAVYASGDLPWGRADCVG